MHQRWETGLDAPLLRRVEDATACTQIGARPRHFSVADCIYRTDESGQPLISNLDAITEPKTTAEPGLVAALGAELAGLFPPTAQVVCPMALGRHVDHRLTRAAAERCGVPILYYQDYPYVLQPEAALERQALASGGWQQFKVTPDGLAAWQRAISAYASQLSTFWSSLEEMQAAIAEYCQQQAGACLWRAE